MSDESEMDESPLTDLGSPVADRVHDLLAPVIATTGLELLDVEWMGGTLRVVIDGDDGVTTEGLASVNRLVGPILDQHDPVPGRYTLEVSSPGVERPLRRVDHYRRAVGEDVVIKLVPTIEPRRLKGRLLSVEDDSVTVEATEIDGIDLAESESHTVPIIDVSKARTVFNWGPTPKKGGKQHPKGQSGKSQSGKSQGGKSQSGKSQSSKSQGGKSKNQAKNQAKNKAKKQQQ